MTSEGKYSDVEAGEEDDLSYEFENGAEEDDLDDVERALLESDSVGRTLRKVVRGYHDRFGHDYRGRLAAIAVPRVVFLASLLLQVALCRSLWAAGEKKTLLLVGVFLAAPYAMTWFSFHVPLRRQIEKDGGRFGVGVRSFYVMYVLFGIPAFVLADFGLATLYATSNLLNTRYLICYQRLRFLLDGVLGAAPQLIVSILMMPSSSTVSRRLLFANAILSGFSFLRMLWVVYRMSAVWRVSKRDYLHLVFAGGACYTPFLEGIREGLIETASYEHEALTTEQVKLIMDACNSRRSAITQLDFFENSLTEEGGQAIGEALAKNNTILKLGVRGNPIRTSGAFAIACAVRDNCTLTELNLGGCAIGPDGAVTIAKALRAQRTLKALNLSSNNLADKGATVMALCLKENTTLRRLNLMNNSIGRVGCDDLGAMLKVNSTLIVLNLDRNFVATEGAAGLSRGLAVNTALTTLSLGSCKLSIHGTEAIAEMLKENSCLRVLNLRENEIGTGGARALKEALRSNVTLCELRLAFNDIDPDVREDMHKARRKGLRLTF
eukprot:PLAT10317.1.p1 GENE.PLAT10317.1~~PLAT10317.1.p1  ORF type:complete len:551 (-),score=207.94 PLAT10317.1:147-1799(-)